MATPSPKTCLTACLLLLLTVASLVASAPFPDHLDSPGRSHGLHVERHGKQDDAQNHGKQNDTQSHDKQDDAQIHDAQIHDAQSYDVQSHDAQRHDKQDEASSIHLSDNYNLDDDKPGHHNSDGEAQVTQTAEGARSPTSTTTALATGDNGPDGVLRRSTKPEKVKNNDMDQVYVTDDPIEDDQGFENGNVRSVNDTPHDDIGVKEQDSGDNDFEINSTQDPSAVSTVSPAPIDQRFFFSEYDDYSYESYDYYPECNCGCGSDCVIYESTYLRNGKGPA